MTERELVIVDYGVGNLRNVYKAVEAAGGVPRVVNRPHALRAAGGIILPGVGALRCGREPAGSGVRGADPRGGGRGKAAAGHLRWHATALRRERGNGPAPWPRPYPRPGNPVCGGHAGPGRQGAEGARDRLNQLQHDGTDPLLVGIPDGAYAYFVHSYYCRPEDDAYTLASTDYGIRYTSVVRRENLWGIQCHPEKSQQVGLGILRNFVTIVVQSWPSTSDCSERGNEEETACPAAAQARSRGRGVSRADARAADPRETERQHAVYRMGRTAAGLRAATGADGS